MGREAVIEGTRRAARLTCKAVAIMICCKSGRNKDARKLDDKHKANGLKVKGHVEPGFSPNVIGRKPGSAETGIYHVISTH